MIGQPVGRNRPVHRALRRPAGRRSAENGESVTVRSALDKGRRECGRRVLGRPSRDVKKGQEQDRCKTAAHWQYLREAEFL